MSCSAQTTFLPGDVSQLADTKLLRHKGLTCDVRIGDVVQLTDTKET